MNPFSHGDAYQVLWLQLADEGRKESLLGSRASQARTAPLPFLMGECFPSVYFEFPLVGDPFLDVTLLYDSMEPKSHVDSPAAEGTDQMLDWFASVCDAYEDVTCGYELDTSKPQLPRAAVHFQPRGHTELVKPFCEAVGEPERAELYLSLYDRMPDGWKPAYFGMFRGREGSPLRVCGYVDGDEQRRCVEDPQHLADLFDTIGFSAFNDELLVQASTLMAAPRECDYQFDIYPDGSLGPIFSLDVMFEIEQPEKVKGSFGAGPIAEVFGLFEQWGVADERWHEAAGAAFARALPVRLDDGKMGKYSFTLMPQWAKARWIDSQVQPAKLYYLGKAGLL